MTISTIQTAFSAGELAPALYARVDFTKYNSSGTTVRNGFCNYRGGFYSRAGTRYILRSLTDVQNGQAPPRLISFQFSVNQGYVLELGNGNMRFHTNGGTVVEFQAGIGAITQANPCVILVPGASGLGWVTGDWISITGVLGMTELNDRFFVITVLGGDHYAISIVGDPGGPPIDSTNFNAYVAGGLAARVYTIGTPWAINDIALLKFTQSADVMSFTHPSYPPYDLTRIAANIWTLTETNFESQQAAPGEPSLSATSQPSQGTSPPTFPCSYAYVVTAINAAGEESIGSFPGNVVNSVDMAVTAGSIVIDWGPVPGAVQYNIYRAPPSYNTRTGDTAESNPVPVGSVFYFVGTTFGTEFVDSNIVPDSSRSPPSHNDPFATGQVISAQITSQGGGYTFANASMVTATGQGFEALLVNVFGQIQAIIIQNTGFGYAPGDFLEITGDGVGAAGVATIGPETGTFPGTVAYFQQRRVYANSNNQPDTYWMSRPGQFTNFDVSPISSASDAITGTPWAQQVNGIQWMIQMPGGLIVLTGKSAWQVAGEGGSALNPQPITPASQQAQQQAFNGVSPVVPPIPVNFNILYVQEKGATVRDFIYNYFTNNWTGTDQTILSSHLFSGYDISQWAYCEEPNKIIWVVRCDGVLLSFTYMKEQEVYGWARHDTQGSFVSVTSVTEPPVDALYVIVRRPWGDGEAYVVERMDDRIWQTAEEPWCVDSGVQSGMFEPDVPITASSITGDVTFIASAPAFPSYSVGSMLRIGGGIARITTLTSDQQISGTWVLSPTQLVP